MKKKILFFALFTILSTSIAFTQDITGHWKGRVMDQYDINYDFKSNGNILTGKDTHYDGTVDSISNGKINADSISFDVPIQAQMTHVTGKLTENGLTIKFAVQGYDLTADLKKTVIN